jgi:hypothetical protein
MSRVRGGVREKLNKLAPQRGQRCQLVPVRFSRELGWCQAKAQKTFIENDGRS